MCEIMEVEKLSLGAILHANRDSHVYCLQNTDDRLI